MIFKARTSYGTDLFYDVAGGVLVSRFPVLTGAELPFEEVDPQPSPLTPFRLFANPGLDGPTAFLIKPSIPYRNLSTGLVLFYNSWMSAPSPILPDDVHLSLRVDGLIAYSALNKMTVITTPEFSDRLHDYFTMV